MSDREAPRTIWLQWKGQGKWAYGVTWCEDRQKDSDVRYIRADSHDALVGACEAAADAIDNLQHDCWSMPDGIASQLRAALELAKATP